MGKYVFLPYNPDWPRIALEEIDRIRRALGKATRVEHVGSTAVPGLGGKGIIDLAVAVVDVETAIKSLEVLGYDHKTHADDLGRRWFLVRGDSGQLIHVHLMRQEQGEFAAMVGFRDYLRNHPGEMARYSTYKRRGVDAAAQKGNRQAKKQAYMGEKEAYIQRILKGIGENVADRLQ